MKKLLTLLLIACSVITTVSAQQKANNTKKPESVIAALNAIINKYGNDEGQVYSVNRNPNTGGIESSMRIVPFNCPANNQQNNLLKPLATCFQKDEPLSYQFLHAQPGSTEYLLLNVITNNSEKNSSLHIRTKKEQEMWFMCCKNPENPQLRDAYAIVWERTDEIKGTVYMVTSLRPDIYEKELETSKKTFKIEGRVDADIKDSLYNIYIANSAEELENIGDDDYVACVPVINKRFEWQTELDHPVVGRLRCIFPDGSLCSAWINLDFVPGETYRITVHNGYYDEDRDYERRVGRNSGKSLLNRRQRQGIDDIKVLDKVEIDTILPAENVHRASEFKPTTEQMVKIMMMWTAIEAQMKGLKAIYESLKPFVDMRSLEGSDNYFKQIIKLNKEVDGNFQELIKYMSSIEASPEEQASKREGMQAIYSAILDFYTKQNKGYAELYKKVGVLPKSAKTAQDYISKLTEKYIKEIGKL